MKRITITLPDYLIALVDEERRRRDVSAAAVVRHAVEQQLGSAEPRRYGFIDLGSGDDTDTAERAEEILAEEWGDPNFDRDPEFWTSHADPENDGSVAGAT